MEPRRLRLRSITFNALVALGMFAMAAVGLVALLSDPPAGSRVGETNRILSAIFGLVVVVLLAWLGFRFATVRVEAGDAELLVVNPLRRHHIRWSDVRAIEIGSRPFFGAMAYVRLTGGVTVWIMALCDEIPFSRLPKRVDIRRQMVDQRGQVDRRSKTEAHTPRYEFLWLSLSAVAIAGFGVGVPLVLGTDWLLSIVYVVGGLSGVGVVANTVARRRAR